MHERIFSLQDREQAAEQALAIKRWTREILKLDSEAIVVVTELACADAGCPLLETVIAVFDEKGSRKWNLTHSRAAVTKLLVHQALTASSAKPTAALPI